MNGLTAQRRALREMLSKVFRDIRGLRGLRRQDVATRMGLEPRSFERFEAGEVRLDIERIFAFAKATDSDPLAIVAALHLKRPELAARCADNKLMLVQAICTERLSNRLGERLHRLDPATLIDAYDRMFDDLVQLLEAREARTRAWFEGSKGPFE